MTLVSQIITDAYRESNLISITASPTTLEQNEALRLLNRVISSVYGFECGELLTPIPVGNVSVHAPWVPPQSWPSYAIVPLNSNLVCNTSSSQTVHLHPNPQDGSRLAVVNVNSTVFDLTLDGNGRQIDGAATLELTDANTQKEWLYDAAAAEWKIVLPLASTDQMPFPGKYDDLFVIMLSMRLNPRNGVQLDPQSQMTLNQLMKQFKAQYHQVIQKPSEVGIVLLPGARSQRGYYDYYYGDPTQAFNYGYGYGWGGY